jgi:ABC-2 type transport system ATP-binding protein
MSEMSQTAEHLVVIGRGELIADVDEAGFVAMASTNVVLVRSPQAGELRDLLIGPDVSVSSPEAGLLEVHGLNAEQIGDVAFEHRVRLHGLAVQEASLEDAFMELTRDSVEFRTRTNSDPISERHQAELGATR